MMQNRENYNLDIGPEHDGRQKIVFTDRKHLNAISSVVFISLAFVFVSMIYVFVTTNSKLAERDVYITSLIDEVGQLKQDRFYASEKKASGNTQGIVLNKDVVLASGGETFDVLILGTNGNLTDTIMIASVNEEIEKITLFSIPRDLYANGRRINEYFYYYGAEQLQRMIASITGITIEKYVKVDLDGFINVIDILGGLDIYVDEAIYDSYYPNSKGGYTAYSIKVGTYHMSGEDALKYARSRKSTSDFDRAERQQKIIQALRTKLLQLTGVTDIKNVAQIIQSAMSNFDTDISILDAISHYNNYKDYELSAGFVLSTQNYLYSIINESGAYTLLPKSGDFEEIKKALSSLVTH